MKYFKPDEFRMGGELVFDKMNTSFLTSLDDLREHVGQPLTINSSYRTLAYNTSIGGAPNSYHMKGMAVDLRCTNSTLRAKIVKEALKLGFTCGIASSFIHIDTRINQIIFLY